MSTTTWIDAASVDDAPTDDVIGIDVQGRDIALYRVEGVLYATDNTCTHGRARLCEGFLLDHEIECPLHQARFDVRTGEPTCGPATRAVRSYPVKVEAGRVWLGLENAAGTAEGVTPA